MQVLEEVAKADASTAWCLGQYSVCATVSAYMDPTTRQEILGAPTDILAWGSIARDVRAAPGGYRATGRWDFASGVAAGELARRACPSRGRRHARQRPDGAPEVRTILFPAASATLYDVWNVIGLKGTGTDSYSVDNLFISEDSPRCATNLGLREQGPLYKITSMFVFAMGFAAVSLGVARAMLDRSPSSRAARHRSA